MHDQATARQIQPLLPHAGSDEAADMASTEAAYNLMLMRLGHVGEVGEAGEVGGTRLRGRGGGGPLLSGLVFLKLLVVVMG